MGVATLLTWWLLATISISTHGVFAAENPDKTLTKSKVDITVPSDVQRPDAKPVLETPPAAGEDFPAGNWKSPGNEIKIGRYYAVQTEQNQRLLQDRAANDYVNGITRDLARACDAPFPISVKIIEREDVGALALPGGFLFITTGFVSAAEDEAELAAAIAHQMAHSCAHQFVRGMTSKEFRKITTQPGIIYGWKSFLAFGGNAGSVLPPFIQDFPPEFEAEADVLALQYLHQAGYDPSALLTLFARLDALKKTDSDLVPNAFASHLQAPGRVQKARRRSKSLPRKDQYIVNSSEFDTVRARLLVLLARRHRNRAKHSGDRSN
ncbi:MAG TPA: M48 family metalloprotease [Candidatus Angelobacter sp.]